MITRRVKTSGYVCTILDENGIHAGNSKLPPALGADQELEGPGWVDEAISAINIIRVLLHKVASFVEQLLEPGGGDQHHLNVHFV